MINCALSLSLCLPSVFFLPLSAIVLYIGDSHVDAHVYDRLEGTDFLCRWIQDANTGALFDVDKNPATRRRVRGDIPCNNDNNNNNSSSNSDSDSNNPTYQTRYHHLCSPSTTTSANIRYNDSEDARPTTTRYNRPFSRSSISSEDCFQDDIFDSSSYGPLAFCDALDGLVNLHQHQHQYPDISPPRGNEVEDEDEDEAEDEIEDMHPDHIFRLACLEGRIPPRPTSSLVLGRFGTYGDDVEVEVQFIRRF